MSHLHIIRPRLTAKRREWLEYLRDHGPGRRKGTVVGYECMHLGWTEWAHRRKDDNTKFVTASEAKELYGEEWWQHVDTTKFEEVITAMGREILKTGGK